MSIRKDADAPLIKRPLMRLQLSPNDPLIVDRWVDVSYISLWFIYGLWGVSAFILGLPTVVEFASDWYQAAWSGAIGCLAITSAILALLVFFETGWMSQIKKKQWERTFVFVLCTFIIVYPGLLILRAFSGDFLLVGPSAVLSFSYVIFPILRIHILKKRIKALKEVEAVAGGADKTL